MAELDFATLWQALAPRGLAAPVAEFRFHPVRKWRFDWAWPAARGGVALEIDGGRWAAGGGRHATDADHEKCNTAAALGWRVLHVTPAALRCDPARVVALCAAALVLGRDDLPGADDHAGDELPEAAPAGGGRA